MLAVYLFGINIIQYLFSIPLFNIPNSFFDVNFSIDIKYWIIQFNIKLSNYKQFFSISNHLFILDRTWTYL